MALNLRLPPDLDKDLKETAKREDRSASAVVRIAIKEYCARSKDAEKK